MNGGGECGLTLRPDLVGLSCIFQAGSIENQEIVSDNYDIGNEAELAFCPAFAQVEPHSPPVCGCFGLT